MMNPLIKSYSVVEDEALGVVLASLRAYPDISKCPGEMRYTLSRLTASVFARRLTLASTLAEHGTFNMFGMAELAEHKAELDADHAIIFWLNARELARLYEIEIKPTALDSFMESLCAIMELDLASATERFHELTIETRRKQDDLGGLSKLLG